MGKIPYFLLILGSLRVAECSRIDVLHSMTQCPRRLLIISQEHRKVMSCVCLGLSWPEHDPLNLVRSMIFLCHRLERVRNRWARLAAHSIYCRNV